MRAYSCARPVLLLAAVVSVLASALAYVASIAEAHGQVDVSAWFAVIMRTNPSPPQAGREAEIVLQISDISANVDPEYISGLVPWSKLSVVHGRKMHLVIMSADQEVFGHVHPDDFSNSIADDDTSFLFRFTFPKSGEYRAVVDYSPQVLNSSSASLVLPIMVAGEEKPAWTSNNTLLGRAFTSVPLEQGEKNVHYQSLSEEGGVAIPVGVRYDSGEGAPDSLFRVEAHLNNDKPIVAGSCVLMKFKFMDFYGRPLTDMSPYLTMPLHVAVAHQDMVDIDHTHGMLPMGHEEHEAPNCTYAYMQDMMAMMPPLRPSDSFGPTAVSFYAFSKPGAWRLVLQASRRNQTNMLLATFLVNVYGSEGEVPSSWVPLYDDVPAAPSESNAGTSGRVGVVVALLTILAVTVLAFMAPKPAR